LTFFIGFPVGCLKITKPTYIKPAREVHPRFEDKEGPDFSSLLLKSEGTSEGPDSVDTLLLECFSH